MADKLELVIVVNGQPTTVEANPSSPLGTIVHKVLAQTGNTGQPPENWELRDAAGVELALDQKIKEFNFTPGTRLFLNLKAGVGG